MSTTQLGVESSEVAKTLLGSTKPAAWSELEWRVANSRVEPILRSRVETTHSGVEQHSVSERRAYISSLNITECDCWPVAYDLARISPKRRACEDIEHYPRCALRCATAYDGLREPYLGIFPP